MGGGGGLKACLSRAGDKEKHDAPPHTPPPWLFSLLQAIQWLRDFLDDPTSSRPALIFALVITAMIVVSIFTFAYESVDQRYGCQQEKLLKGLEWFFNVVFTLEMLLRITIGKGNELAADPLLYFDMLAVMPFWLGMRLAPCALRLAPCSSRLAPCSLRHARCYGNTPYTATICTLLYETRTVAHAVVHAVAHVVALAGALAGALARSLAGALGARR